MSRAERDKGAAYEREVAAVLRAHGLPVDRTGRQSGVTVRGDLTGVPHYHLECRRRETLRMPLWLRETAQAARDGDVPVLIFRQNRGESYGCLPLDALARLLDLARLTS